MIRMKSKKIGLALGGGAARGFSHIGVLKVLARENIDISYVAGTSAGSIIGALFCAGLSWEEINRITGEIQWDSLLAPAWPKLGLVNSRKLEIFLNHHIDEQDFEDLGIPFQAVAVDITKGTPVILKSGQVARAVRASCSIPGIFEPVRVDNRLLIDGGVMNNVPADVVRDMGADLVIAVDLNAHQNMTEEPSNILDVLFYTFNIMAKNSRKRELLKADVVIEPDLEDLSFYSLNNAKKMMERGEQAMKAKLAEVKSLLNE